MELREENRFLSRPYRLSIRTIPSAFLLHDQCDSHVDGDELADGNSVGETLRPEGNTLAIIRLLQRGHVTPDPRKVCVDTHPHSSLTQYLLSISCWFSLIMKDWMLVLVPEGHDITEMVDLIRGQGINHHSD